LAVSKRHPVEAIRAAHAAGQREFGENYAQELVAKAEQLRDVPDLRLRFIGHLQRNKAKELARIGCAIDTIDSLRLAETLDRRLEGLFESVEVLLQINVDEEAQKGGVPPAEAGALAAQVAALPRLSLRGVMAIPEVHPDPEQMRPAFRRLRELAGQLELPVISMGMSADLEVAIEEGSTMVRVGTAIFGPRPT
jgi:pyridoxal phosphate enzyme (YggS family)